MRNIGITKREILVSVIIVLLMVGLGYFISTAIHNNVTVGNEKYFKALQVDDNPELFNYAIETQVGGVLSYGVFKANESVTDSLIEGEYFSMIKNEEHYVMKTRVVTYVDSDGNSKTRTETYWEWDVVKRELFITKTFEYLGRDFNFSTVEFNNHRYNDTVKKKAFSDVRWVYYTIPKEFNATLYSQAESKTIKKNEIYPNQTIEALIAKVEKGADSAVIVFWIVWAVLIVIIVGIFVALDNKFINNKMRRS